MAKCRGCGAEIEWISTHTGKHIPIDPDPVHVAVGSGREAFVTDDGDVIHGRRVQASDESAEVGFVSHWATCPVAGMFRRGQK